MSPRRGGCLDGRRVGMSGAYLTGTPLDGLPGASPPSSLLVVVGLVLPDALTSRLNGEEGLHGFGGRCGYPGTY
jgi:hypothetical protein